MENVRQSTSYGNINVPEKVASFLERNGYTAWWTILNAADFGVPQVRERMILFAVKGKVFWTDSVLLSAMTFQTNRNLR